MKFTDREFVEVESWCKSIGGRCSVGEKVVCSRGDDYIEISRDGDTRVHLSEMEGKVTLLPQTRPETNDVKEFIANIDSISVKDNTLWTRGIEEDPFTFKIS